MAIPLLPLLALGGATVGGIQGYRRSGGNLGAAALGAGTGALTASGAGGFGRFAGQKALGMALGKGGMGSLAGRTFAGMAAAGDPAAKAILMSPALAGAAVGAGTILTGNLGVGPGTQRPVGGLAGLAGYKTVKGEPMTGSAVPLGMGGYGGVNPTGYPLDVLSPLGLDAGRRLRTVKDAEALRDATNIVLPTVRKFSEQAKKDDFARSMASRSIAQNIATNAALTQGMAQATRQLGTTAAQQAGAALTNQYNY